MNFSVLMSVYDKENEGFLNESLESILINQTKKPNEVVIVKDGPLPTLLENVISKYKNRFPEIIKIVSLEKNQGLGNALNIGLENCKYELIARMDSDDICESTRFEEQIKTFVEKPEIDILGGHIFEFFQDRNIPVHIKKVPLDESGIGKMIKSRNPINHMTVMFKKNAIIEVGGYKHLLYAEDYYLWIRSLASGKKLMNIDTVLVRARTGDNMFKRRSNPEYIRSWFFLQKELKRFMLISYFRFFINMVSITLFIIINPSLKKKLYSYFLRN